METAMFNGVKLEYEVTGSGEPLLLISTGPIADSFLPLVFESTLVDHYRLIRYRQRGQAGSTPSTAPVSFAQHAQDAAGLLDHMGISRAHIAGHSTGGDIALELALARPDLVHTLVLLEPALMGVPSAAAFYEKAGPALSSFAAGDHEKAMAEFLSVVCSLDWHRCRTVIEKHVPSGVAQAMEDAGTFFGSYLPALTAWEFGPQDAASISQPVLSVLGTESDPLFTEGRDLIHSWFPQAVDLTIEDVAHLLHLQRPEPVARGVAAFLELHPMMSAQRSAPHASLITG